MTQKRSITANFVGASPTTDAARPFTIRGRDQRDSERPVVIHMTYEEMIEARDQLNELIDNPPSWTRMFTRHNTDAPEG